MNHNKNRREFLKGAALGVGALGATALTGCKTPFFSGGKLYDISLAQWSLNRQFFGGKIDALDFAKVSREEFDAMKERFKKHHGKHGEHGKHRHGHDDDMMQD